jgi:hypothetical protein
MGQKFGFTFSWRFEIVNSWTDGGIQLCHNIES